MYLKRFLKKILTVIRNIAFAALLLTGIVAGLLPAALGLVLRQQITPTLENLSAAREQNGSLTVSIEQSHAGWFNSSYQLRLQGTVLSTDGQTSASQTVLLSIMHGPLIWHLYNSLFAVAELQLINLSPVTGPDTPHLSGSGLLTLDETLNMRLRAIAGFSALGGDHWLDLRMQWPALAQIWPVDLQRWPARAELRIDADARALAAGPAADALNVYEQQNWTRISNGRALTQIRLDREILDINGNTLPLALFFVRDN